MASRGRKLIIRAAIITLSLGVLAMIGVVWLLNTQSGLGFVRGRLVALVAGRVHGKLYVGTIGCSILSRPCIDSVEVRDRDDSVLVATGPITFKFDALDLWAGRISFDSVVVQRPYVHLRRDSTGKWNYKKVFGSETGIPRAPSVGRKFGDVFLLDRVTLRDGEFRWTEPWSPSPWWQGTQRDSVIKAQLARTDIKVLPHGSRFLKIRRWTNLQLDVPHARIKHPDSAGVAIQLARLDVDEADPPFILRNARGAVTIARDTVDVAIDAFRLPGSAGSARGKLFIKRGLGVRVRVMGDTVSMSDIAWLYPTLPTEGGGKMVLDIRKDSTLDHIDYKLTQLDVRSTKSHLAGAMTFGVGEAILSVTDVDLKLDPVDFKLFEQLSGAPLPLPWAGQLNGIAKGKGGPLNRFWLDTAVIAFTDANVPGVVNRFSGKGEIDIVRPSYAAFHDFSAQVHHFDLRTARALNDSFPPWKGWAYGTARLDSSWFDVRIRDGDFHYAADTALVSHFTGGGRVITGEVEMIYDLALNADPLRAEAIALAYPKVQVRGTYKGPFTVKGGWEDMRVGGELTGEGARVAADLRMDALPPGYSITGKLTLANVDLSRVMVNADSLKGDLSGEFNVSVAGDSLANARGTIRANIGRSMFKGVRVFGGATQLTLGEGLARVDTLSLHSTIGTLFAKGALGLVADRRDSLGITVNLDSLGGLRPLIAPITDTLPVDSLRGSVNVQAYLKGNIDSLDLRMTAQGSDLAYGLSTARRLTLDADIKRLRGERTGTVTLTADTALLGNVLFQRASADAQLLARDRARVRAHMHSTTGTEIDGGANVSWDSLAFRTAIDSLALKLSDREWRLSRTATFAMDANGFTLDTLDLAGANNARLTLALSAPDSARVAGFVSAKAFPLADLGQLLQVSIPISGASAVEATIAGTRGAPVIDFAMKAADATLGTARVEGLNATGRYENRALNATVEYTRRGVTVLHGQARLPMDLALRPVAKRLLNEPLSGTLDADTTDLAVIETFTSSVTNVAGRFDAHLKLAGTWEKPQLTGALSVANGAVSIPSLGGVRYDRLRASIGFFGDSININQISAHSGGPADTARFFGWLNFANREDPEFQLYLIANHFRVIDDRTLATLYLTVDRVQGLRLVGKQSSSDIVGAITPNGRIYIPDSFRKNVIVIDDPDYLNAMDTTVAGARSLLPTAPPKVVQNMRVNLLSIMAGEDLWLNSTEANIQLGGSLRVTQATTVDRATGRSRPQLALDGDLTALQGTYRLSLGLVQKTFNVEPNSSVKFFGDALDPTLAITAMHTIRQYDQRDAQQDVRIRATIGGTLLRPTVALSSPDSTRIVEADYVSYLLTGAPSLEIGRTGAEYQSLAGGILVNSFGSLLTSRFSGRFFSNFEVRTSALEAGYGGGIRKVGSNLFSGTRLNAGKQIANNTFLRLDVGLCQIGQLIDTGSLDPVGFLNSTGVKLERRFGEVGVSGGLDPATSAVICAQGASARGFVPTPRQLGIDFSKLWRW